MGSGAQVKTGAWDPEEDDLLYYWQSKVGNKWSEVAKHIPGRTGQQCAQRWRHKVNPNIRRDKWTAEEDAKLIDLVKTFGVGRWAEIARNCHGRTDQQCMGRWRRHLDPSIRRDSWTPEEDAKLRQLHAQHGTSWSRISKNLKGRTSQQCRARWHQINNTRSKSCGSGAGSAPAAAGGNGGRQAGGRKAASTKRKSSSRRRHESSCSEDDEDDEEDYYEEEDDFDEAVEEQAGSSGAHSGSGSQQQEQEQQQQQEYAAAVAAAAAAGYGYGAAELQQPWVATFAAGVLHGALSAGQTLPQQYSEQQQDDSEGAQKGAGEAEVADDAADPDSPSGHGSDGAQYGAALTHHKSLPARLGSSAAPFAAAGSRALEHTGSLPSARRAPAAGSGCMSPNALWPAGQPQQYAGGLAWSPSRLLLSPQRPEHRARGGRLAAAVDLRKDLNEEEAAGAETLLEMASLLQQESCELQPAQLPLPAYTPPKRPAGDRLPLPAYTPPKRPAGDKLEEDLPEGLSPSPYKRARSSRLFAAAGDEAHDEEGEDEGALEPAQQQRSRAAGTRRSRISRQSSPQHVGQLLQDEEPSPQPSPAAAAASGRHRRSEARHFRVPHARPAAAAAAADKDEADADEADAGAADDSPALLGDMRARGPAANLEHADPVGRPSNASSFTGLRSQDAMAVAAAAVAAAVFMSPTCEVRGTRHGAPGSATATPNRQGSAQHQNAMGLLSSPLFERMVGCATPPSAGRTQPSAATLAALQSPQPSRVPEPFWTPFTGLFQDALFSRGTSATPDLPSAGKPRLPRGLFSPAGQRSGSASGGKVAARRGLLAHEDARSPLGASGNDMEDDKHGSQPSGGSAECASAAAAADAETGPSPAAACGVHPPLSAVHHRVVRRLDQHEAWGTSRASPSKHGRSAEAPSKHQGLATGGTGFSMFSPVKKQRVPLFNETATIRVGATPSKPEAPGADHLLPIAPLKHNLAEQPSSSAAGESGAQHQQQGSPEDRLAAASASVLMHGRSPLGAKARDRAPAGRHVSLPLAAASPPASRQQSQQQQQQEATAGQQQQEATAGQQQQEEEGEDQVESGLERQQSNAAAAAAAAGAHGHAAADVAAAAAVEVDLQGSPGFEQADDHRAAVYDVPDTPVNVAVTADNTSCSGTPNTPAGMRADATGGRGQLVSPNDYVTPPQHRLRASRPLAPLHKDCLIAAATRSLADGLAAQQRRTQRQPASSTGTGRTSAAAAAAAALDSPGQCSSDSSKMLSCEREMDSPLEATGFSHSPSQWHQGMVAMLRGLQQTPLQPKDQAGQPPGAAAAEAAAAAKEEATAAAQAAAAAAPGPPGSSPAVITGREVVGSIKVCSRALRRLQDELERGSTATAAATAAIIARQQQQRQQGGQRSAQLQQRTDVKDSDAEVPFAGGLSLAPGPTPAGPSCSSSTPLVLPLFTTPAAAATGSRLPVRAQPGAAAAGRNSSTTPLALQPHSSSAVASVSLTPAVVTLHTPAASGAMSTMTPRMPAVAWPVQQRSDGGLMVSAPMTTVPAAAATAGPAGGVVQLTPAASTTKAASGMAGASPFPAAATAAATPSAARCPSGAPAAGAGAVGGLWLQASPLSVISIQPLTLLATACNAAAGQSAALQSVLTLQPTPAAARVHAAAPGASSATPGVPEQLRSAGAAAAAAAAGGGSVLRDSSHAVRSRLHALIDSV